MSPVGDAHQLYQVFSRNDDEVLATRQESQNKGTEEGG